MSYQEWKEYLAQVGDLGRTEFDILDDEDCDHLEGSDYGDGRRCDACGSPLSDPTDNRSYKEEE